MNTLEVGQQLVSLCREGKNLEAIEGLYADSVVSVEAAGPERVMSGKEAVIGKYHWWAGAHEVHSASVQGPYPHDDQFAVLFSYDVTMKESGARVQLEEVALYTVEDGKIVKEQFFYTM